MSLSTTLCFLDFFYRLSFHIIFIYFSFVYIISNTDQSFVHSFWFSFSEFLLIPFPLKNVGKACEVSLYSHFHWSSNDDGFLLFIRTNSLFMCWHEVSMGLVCILYYFDVYEYDAGCLRIWNYWYIPTILNECVLAQFNWYFYEIFKICKLYFSVFWHLFLYFGNNFLPE